MTETYKATHLFASLDTGATRTVISPTLGGLSERDFYNVGVLHRVARLVGLRDPGDSAEAIQNLRSCLAAGEEAAAEALANCTAHEITMRRDEAGNALPDTRDDSCPVGIGDLAKQDGLIGEVASFYLTMPERFSFQGGEESGPPRSMLRHLLRAITSHRDLIEEAGVDVMADLRECDSKAIGTTSGAGDPRSTKVLTLVGGRYDTEAAKELSLDERAKMATEQARLCLSVRKDAVDSGVFHDSEEAFTVYFARGDMLIGMIVLHDYFVLSTAQLMTGEQLAEIGLDRAVIMLALPLDESFRLLRRSV